jgi:hypothetical protein
MEDWRGEFVKVQNNMHAIEHPFLNTKKNKTKIIMMTR